MRRPLRHHNKNHKDTGVPFEECPVCERDRLTCQKKIRFVGWFEANEWVTELNESQGYTRPVTRYRCRWCDGWHMKRAKDVRSRARMEKQRRKWLQRQAAEGGQEVPSATVTDQRLHRLS